MYKIVKKYIDFNLGVLIFTYIIRNIFLSFLVYLNLVPTPLIAKAQMDSSKEVVILLHGLGRTSRSMDTLQSNLEKEGYFVKNINYPSRKYSCEILVETYIAPIISNYKNAQKIHFVTHSLGGILIRLYLLANELPNLGSVVMLGPPNKGSGIVNKLRRYKLVKWYMGPAFLELSTDPDSIPNQLVMPNYSIGVIAGTKSYNPFLSSFLKGQNDGKVEVSSAHIQGVSLKVLPVSHTWMMKNKKVIKNVIYFLRNNSFI